MTDEKEKVVYKKDKSYENIELILDGVPILGFYAAPLICIDQNLYISRKEGVLYLKLNYHKESIEFLVFLKRLQEEGKAKAKLISGTLCKHEPKSYFTCNFHGGYIGTLLFGVTINKEYICSCEIRFRHIEIEELGGIKLDRFGGLNYYGLD